MQGNEIDHRAVPQPVNEIAERAAANQRIGQRQAKMLGRAHEIGKKADSGQRNDDQENASRCAAFGKQPIADAVIPNQGEVEKRQNIPRFMGGEIGTENNGNFAQLVERGKPQRQQQGLL